MPSPPRVAPVAVAALTVAAILASPPVAGAAELRATGADLAATLDRARPGDTVLLEGGSVVDPVTVPEFRGEVTLAPDPATSRSVRGLRLRGGAALRVEGFDLQGFQAIGTRDLTLAGNDVTVGGAFFEFTDGLRITGNRIHDAWDGLVIDDASGFTVSRNECWAVPLTRRRQSGDCLQLARVHRFEVTDNVFRDQPSKPHADAIEVTDSNSDGLFARNRFSRVRGIVFTPGDNTPLREQTRMTVVNNLFAKTRSFAINGVRMVDSAFLHNTAPDGGFVQIGGASTGNVVAGNIMRAFYADPRRQRTVLALEDFNVIARVRSGYRRGPHDLTGAATFVRPAVGDYHLARGSKGIGAGSPDWMPADDLEGTTRTQPDLGALAFAP